MTQLQRIALVNASGGAIADGELARVTPDFQVHIDEHLLPAWIAHGAIPTTLEFMSFDDFKKYTTTEFMPIFFNRHSTDPDALGFHTEEGQRIYGRVFVGDCIRYNISYTVDGTHEIDELICDPHANRGYKMPDGRIAALEVSDAVEADQCGYRCGPGQTLVSDFVYPAYFSAEQGAKYDHRELLKHYCDGTQASLYDGGYMSISTAGEWGQITKDDRAMLRSARSMRTGWRRRMRASVGVPTNLLNAAA